MPQGSSDYNMTLCRFTATGNYDNGFGSNGCVDHGNAAGGNDWDFANFMFMSGDGYSNAYVIGSSYNSDSFYDITVWAFE